MKVYETFDTVLNHSTGEISSMKKVKPLGPTRGNVKIELFNPDGSLDTSAAVHNIAMDWMDDLAYNAMYFSALTYDFGAHTNGDASTYVDTNVTFPTPLRYLTLTDWDKPEHKDTPFICGTFVANAQTGYQYSGSSTSQGTYNSAESRRYINTEGQYVQSYVYDWPTHAANGTFQSLWLSNRPRGTGMSRASTVRYWEQCPGWPTDLISYIRTGGSSSSSYSYCRPYYWNYTVRDNVVTVYVTSSYGYTSANPFYAPALIYRFDTNTGNYISHITLTGLTRTPKNQSTPVPTSDGGFFIIDWISSATTTYVTKVDAEGNQVDYYTIATGSFTDDNDNPMSPNTGYSFSNSYVMAVRPADRQMIYFVRSQVDDKYYNYKIYYDLETKTHTKVFLNPIVNPYIPAEYRDTTPITMYTENSYTPDYMCLYYWTSSTNYVTAGTFTCANKDKFIFLGDFNCVVYGYNFDEMYISAGYSSFGCYPRTIPPTTHTLLPAPVTKTSTHTMKITYEVLVDLVPYKSNKNFLDHLSAR